MVAEPSTVEGAQGSPQSDNQQPPSQVPGMEPSNLDLVQSSEGRAQGPEQEIGRLQSTIEGQKAEISALRDQMASAVSRYRSVLLASVPEVPEDLVQGQTVEELDRSLASARRMVERIAAQLETRAGDQRVPSGAPPRRGRDLSSLSPREKILHALQRG